MDLLRARKAVSSAYWKMFILGGRGGRSATNMKYNKGDREEPCGMPQ